MVRARWSTAVSSAFALAACREHFDAAHDAAADATCTSIPGLVAYFPMEPGDIAGSVLRDRSGNAHDGAMVGAFALAPGHIGSALQFPTAAVAYVDVAGLPFPTAIGDAVTVTMWFFAPSDDKVLVDMPPPTVRYDVWIISSQLCINTQNSECWGAAGAVEGRWAFVAAIFRNGAESTSELYLDGQPLQISCTTDPMYPCTASRFVANPMRLGAMDGYAFDGLEDDVRLYDHALSPTDIAALFAGAQCGP